MASQKKDKINSKHIEFLNLAFEQAKINLGSTKTNPSVGCVVEKNGSIISSGCTSFNGYPHAEFNALNKNLNFKNSNIYITLEPCTHYGKTPPCTNIIIRKKPKNVYYSLDDFDERTTKKAKTLLIKKNIKVNKNLLKNKALDFYESYQSKHINKLPLLDAKIALSNDFFTIHKEKKWITNQYSRSIGHLLRSRYECIITTSETLNKDNAILNCRIKGLENKTPDLVIVDRKLKIKKTLSIFKNEQISRKIIIFTYSNNLKRLPNFFKKNNIKLYGITKNKNEKKEIISIIEILKKRGYTRLFVEAGLKFISFLIKEKIIKYLYIFKSNNRLNSKGKNNFSVNYIKNIKLKNKQNVFLFGDKLFKEKIR